MASLSKQPKPLPELVRDSQLETRFASKGQIVHIFRDTPTTAREEVWKRGKKPIGRGAFGEVWLEKCIKGQEPGGPETRAVKVLRLIPQGEIRLEVSDYSRELEALVKFSQRKFSRCFVRFYGWYHGRDVLCVGLEYLPLGDLRGYLSTKGGRVPQTEAQQIVSQLLDGLRFMHEEGFTHRDLKPANVLIKDRPPSGSWWVVLSDFGLTKRVENNMTGTSGLLGTPGYMAPELYGFFASGAEGIDYSAADIWCVGEMSFQMISGEPTFSYQATLFSYARGECEFPAHKLRDCCAEGDPRAIDFITKLMPAHPAHRPDAAAALSHPWIADQRKQSYAAVDSPPASVLNVAGSTASVTSSGASSASSEEYGVWSLTASNGKRQEFADSALPGEEMATTTNNSRTDDIPSHQIGVRDLESAGNSMEIAKAIFRRDDSSDEESKFDRAAGLWRVADLSPPLDAPQAMPGTGLADQHIIDAAQERTLRPDPSQRVPPEDTNAEAEGGLSGESISRLIPSGSGTKRISHQTLLIKSLHSESVHEGERCLAAAFSPVKPHILAVLYDRSIRLWNLRTGLIEQQRFRNRGLEPPESETSAEFEISGQSPSARLNRCCIAFSPNAEVLACSYWPIPVIYIFYLHTSDRRVLSGHEGPITWIQFSPTRLDKDELVLASASLDKTVRLWHLVASPYHRDPSVRLKPRRKPEVLKHGSQTVWLGFVTPDNPPGSREKIRVLSISEDGQEHLWRRRHGPLPRVISRWREMEDHCVLCNKNYTYQRNSPMAVATAAISRNENFIAVGEATAADQGAIHFWYRDRRDDCKFKAGLRSIQQRGTIQSISFFTCQYSEELFIFVVSDESASIYTYGTLEPHGKVLEISKSKSSTNPRRSAKVASNSNLLAFGSDAYPSIQVWGNRFVMDLNDLQHHLDQARFSAFSRDRRYAASIVDAVPASPLGFRPLMPCTIMIWDVVDACPYRLIRASIGTCEEDMLHPPLALSFLEDSKTIACVSWTHNLHMWNVETGKPLETVPFELRNRTRKILDPSVRIGILGSHFAAFACPYKHFGALDDERCAGILVSYTRLPGVPIPGLSFTDGTNVIHVKRSNPNSGIISLALSRDGHSLAEISKEGYITVWQLRPDLKQIGPTIKLDPAGWGLGAHLTGLDRPHIAFSPDGNRLAIFSQSLVGIEFWSLGSNGLSYLLTIGKDMPTHYTISSLFGGSRNYQPGFVSPDWRWCIITAPQRGGYSFSLWDLNRKHGSVLPGFGQLNTTSAFHSHGVSFSTDSQLVAVGFFGLGILQVWYTHTQQERMKINIGEFDDGVFFWPDSKRVATTSRRNKMIRIWDIETGERIRTFEGHTGNYVVDDIDL